MTRSSYLLSDIRVLDFTLIWAGPYGVMLLGDLGAEIIRVESTQKHIVNTRGFFPKPTRKMVDSLGSLGRLYPDMEPGEAPWNRHALFHSLGRNRASMTVDLRTEEGQAVIHELVRVSDVIFDNNSRGLLDSFNLDYQTVRALNPALVYVSMPIFGLDGPYNEYIGFGPNAEGLAGFSSLRGYMDSDLTVIGNTNHMDATSGVAAAYAALMALHERDRTGKGQLIEFDQMEHMIHQIGGPLMDAVMNGRAQHGLGNRDAVRAPQGVYPCRGHDRWVALSIGTDAEWHALCELIGLPELVSDERYEGNIARQRRHDEIDQAISEWTSKEEPGRLVELLQDRGVPSALVATDKDVYDDPHMEARGFFTWAEHPECGRHRYPGHPFKYSESPLRFEAPPPLLGQHNDLVYRELLGKPDVEVQRLKDLGHIGNAYTEEAIRRG